MNNNVRLALKKLRHFQCPCCKTAETLVLYDQITVERSWPLGREIPKRPDEQQLEAEPFFLQCGGCDTRFDYDDPEIGLTDRQWEDLQDYVQRRMR